MLLILLTLIPSTGGAIGSPGIEALFLERIGARFLPYMYMALGVITFVASMVLTAMLGRLSKRRLYLGLPVVLSGALIIARVLVSLDFKWVYPGLWLGMYLLWTLQSMLCWGMAAAICDTRQAKRLFPLFSAGSILGIAVGGLLTQPLVRLTGTENLLLVWAAALMITFGLVVILARRLKEPFIPSWHTPPRLSEEIQRGYQFVRRSNFMQWFSLAALLFSVLFFSLAFPFSRAAAVQFPDDKALAGFLGVFQGLTTGVAFFTSLLLANRLFARSGYMGALLVFSLIYFLGFGMLSVYQVFTSLLAFRFLQMAWLQGIAEPASQGVFNIVPPERREQVRAFINGVPTQIGTVIGGLLLVVGEQVLQPWHLYLIGTTAAAITALVIWRARRAYHGALVDALHAGQPQIFSGEQQPFGGFRSDAAAVAVAAGSLSDNSPAVRRLSVEILGRLALPEMTGRLADRLRDEDPGVRIAALRALEKMGAGSALLDATGLLKDPEAEVRQQAIVSLSKVSGFSRSMETHLRPLLYDRQPAVRAQAAGVLLRHAADPQAKSILVAMAGARDPDSRILALGSLSEAGYEELYDLAAAALADPDPRVRGAAAHTIQSLSPQRCIFPLIQALDDEDRYARQEIAKALGSAGEPALLPTLQVLSDPALEDGALMALEHLPLNRSEEAILKYARSKIKSALRDHHIWLQVSSASENDGGEGSERLMLLLDSLRHRALARADYALRAIGLLGERASIDLVRDNLANETPEQRANALETLDTLPERELLRPLFQLWETVEIEPGPVENWLAHLLADPDPWLRACAALVACGGKDPLLQDKLQALAENDLDPFVRSAIDHLLSLSCALPQDGGEKMKTMPTLSIMERILCLRRVPLFSGFSPADLKRVAAIAGEHYFADGELIAAQGEPGDEMFIIISGEVQVVVKDGRAQKIIALREPGEYVGEMSIISREPRMASLIAQGDLRLLCINQKSFESILRERPETSLALMRVLIARLKEAHGNDRISQG